MKTSMFTILFRIPEIDHLDCDEHHKHLIHVLEEMLYPQTCGAAAV